MFLYSKQIRRMSDEQKLEEVMVEETTKMVKEEVTSQVAAVSEQTAWQELKGYWLSCSAWCDTIHHVEAPVLAKPLVPSSTESK
jgi:hypothetical protein